MQNKSEVGYFSSPAFATSFFLFKNMKEDVASYAAEHPSQYEGVQPFHATMAVMVVMVAVLVGILLPELQD